jgi:hypothetical protein
MRARRAAAVAGRADGARDRAPDGRDWAETALDTEARIIPWTLRDSLLVAAAVLLTWGASLAGPFHFDDYSLLADPAVASPDGWKQMGRAAQTRPLTYLTFWLNYQIGGSGPAGYHVVNLALHLAVALRLRAVLAKLLPAQIAVLAALLFAVHPIQSEPVNYIFARAILLAALLCVFSLDLWLCGRPWGAAAAYAGALLAKEECAAFPLLLALLDVSRARGRRAWRPIGVMLALSLGAGLRVLYALAAGRVEGAGATAGISPLEYFWTQGVVIWRYLRLLALPWGFSVDPPVEPASAGVGLAAWLALAAASTPLAARRFAQAREGFWWIAGLVLLLPSSSVFPAADLAADRRVYLPLLAWAPAAALWLARWRTAFLAPLVLLWVMLGMGRTAVWNDGRALWEEAAAQAPRKVRPKLQLARHLPPAQALALLAEAERLAPRDPAIATEQGRAWLAANQPAQALAAFGRALALEPGNARYRSNRGVALSLLGQTDAAARDFESALKSDPCLFDAHLNLKRLGRSAAPPADCRWTAPQRAAFEQSP